MIIKQNVLTFVQILPTSTIRNIRRTVRRACMLILGLKGLIRTFKHLKISRTTQPFGKALEF